MMVGAERIYIFLLMIKTDKLSSFFLSQCFQKEKENNHILFVCRVIETLVKVGDNLQKLWHLSFSKTVTCVLI